MPDTAWIPESCTLPTADRPLRVAAFDQLLTDAVLDTTRVTSQQLRLTLRPEPDIAARTAELAARETACCGFFTFTLTVTGDRLLLDIGVPPTQTAVLDALATRR